MVTRNYIKGLVCFIVLVIIIAAFAMPCHAVAGEETEQNEGYIEIYTENDLRAIGENLNGNYRLMADITLSDEWIALGPFAGTFDGNGFVIKNIYNSNCSGAAGLFSTNKGVVKNTNIQDATFVFNSAQGRFFHGGAICALNGGVVENCTVQNIKITCSAQGFEGSAEALVGGIVGWSEYGTIRYCSASNVNISANLSLDGGSSNYYMNDVGGIVGFARGGTIYDCIAVKSTLDAQSFISYYDYIVCGVGGICGYALNKTQIYNCFAIDNTVHSNHSEESILGLDGRASLRNNYTAFDGTFPKGFAESEWGVRGIHNYPVIIKPQDYRCQGGHTPSDTWVFNRAETCDFNNERIQLCAVCGKAAQIEIVKTEGHTYGKFIVKSGNVFIPPIVKERSCLTCGHIEQTTVWSFVWVPVLTVLTVAGFAVGCISFVRAYKNK